MSKQTAHTVLMIEPVAFGFNEQTAGNNYFQQKADAPATTIQAKALQEFNQMVERLRNKGINVITVKDTEEPRTPDSIFPNNWVSFHDDGTVVIYPMFAENRRKEQRFDILLLLIEQGFQIKNIRMYSLESWQMFLEGTGSMVLDRERKIAYAALSERTHEKLFSTFCHDFMFLPVAFVANQTVNGERLPVYHTNVVMSNCDRYAVVCLDAIDDQKRRKQVARSLRNCGKEIIKITERQMQQFAGNVLQLENKDGEKFLVISETAYNSLSKQQIAKLSSYNEIIRVSIPTIEKYGGGSARCMIAEVFLPEK
jgi:hypothetical protein